MSMELYVICRKPIVSTDNLQSSIHDLGFDLKINTQRNVDESSGHLSAEWKAREAGFELSPFPPEELSETYPESDFGGVWPHGYVFYFGTLAGCVSASIAAAALARATDGIVFDPQENAVMSADDAAAFATENEAHFARIALATP